MLPQTARCLNAAPLSHPGEISKAIAMSDDSASNLRWLEFAEINELCDETATERRVALVI